MMKQILLDKSEYEQGRAAGKYEATEDRKNNCYKPPDPKYCKTDFERGYLAGYRSEKRH